MYLHLYLKHRFICFTKAIFVKRTKLKLKLLTDFLILISDWGSEELSQLLCAAQPSSVNKPWVFLTLFSKIPPKFKLPVLTNNTRNSFHFSRELLPMCLTVWIMHHFVREDYFSEKLFSSIHYFLFLAAM